jgi:hypothetical protein
VVAQEHSMGALRRGRLRNLKVSASLAPLHPLPPNAAEPCNRTHVQLASSGGGGGTKPGEVGRFASDYEQHKDGLSALQLPAFGAIQDCENDKYGFIGCRDFGLTWQPNRSDGVLYSPVTQAGQAALTSAPKQHLRSSGSQP